MREFLAGAVLLVLFLVLMAFETHPGTFEWTFDGSRHVLKLGNTK